MSFKIVTAEERLKERRGIKGVIFGKSGIGKTSLLWTLDAAKTLFIDLEAGDLAIEGLEIDSIRPKTWEEFRDFAVFLGGPNPALRPDQSFSHAHYAAVCEKFAADGITPDHLSRYDTYFIDSITVLGRLSFQWAKGQPEAFSEKKNKPDMLGAYGLHGRELISALVHLQHTRNKNIWFVGILDEKRDDFGRTSWVPQIEGSKTGLELPGIVDEVLTLAEFAAEDGTKYRAFVTDALNPQGFPAKDRSGRLDLLEEPHLGKLMAKISGPKRADRGLEFATPVPAAAE
jgi:AAA domain